MTLAVLPHITLVASHGMGTIIEIVSMHTTSSTVEVPLIIVLLALLKISLKLFLLRSDLSFRLAFRALSALSSSSSCEDPRSPSLSSLASSSSWRMRLVSRSFKRCSRVILRDS